MIIYKKIKEICKKYKLQEVFFMKKGEIQAVHDDDLLEFLRSIEELEKVESGKIKCYFCNRLITLKNIQSVFPLDNEVKYCCNSSKCYSKLLERSYWDDAT